MSTYEIKKLVNQIAEQMQIETRLFVRVVVFKNKIASVSFNSHILRLNRDFVRLSNVSLLRYIIIHELVHIKLGHHYHNKEFYQEIKKYLEGEILQYDKEIYNLMVS